MTKKRQNELYGYKKLGYNIKIFYIIKRISKHILDKVFIVNTEPGDINDFKVKQNDDNKTIKMYKIVVVN